MADEVTPNLERRAADTGPFSRPNILAYFAVLALTGLILLLFFKGDDLSEFAQNGILVLIGTLVGIVKDIYSYEFNSSRSSAKKDDTIANLVKDQK